MTMENVNFRTYTESSLVDLSALLLFISANVQLMAALQQHYAGQSAVQTRESSAQDESRVPVSSACPVHALSTVRILQQRRPQKAWVTGYRPWKSKECRTGGHESGLEAADHHMFACGPLAGLLWRSKLQNMRNKKQLSKRWNACPRGRLKLKSQTKPRTDEDMEQLELHILWQRLKLENWPKDVRPEKILPMTSPKKVR